MRNLVTIEQVGNRKVVNIRVYPSGLPRITVLFPTGGMFANVDDRAAYLANCVDGLTMIGWFVIRSSMRMVHGPRDRAGEKTTLSVTVRPCKDNFEAAEIERFILRKEFES